MGNRRGLRDYQPRNHMTTADYGRLPAADRTTVMMDTSAVLRLLFPEDPFNPLMSSDLKAVLDEVQGKSVSSVVVYELSTKISASIRYKLYNDIGQLLLSHDDWEQFLRHWAAASDV
jgi:hypothetical protein